MSDVAWHRTFEQHREACVALAPAPTRVDVPVLEARRLVLAEDVHATLTLPATDVSAMDGFAVRHADLREGVVLRVVGDVPAGAPADGEVTEGTAVRVMTGAGIPAGADTVVAVELTDIPRGPVPLPKQITVREVPPLNDAIRKAGSDVESGSLVASAGMMVGPLEVAALAALGRPTIPVLRLPRVRCVATGAELRGPGEPLEPGQLHDSNSYALAALCESLGHPVERVTMAHDDPDAMATALPGLLADVDVLVFTGGVSAGAFEVVRQTLAERGVEFGQVAMQPGKPQGVGVIDGVTIFCLPGNPVSTVVSFLAFVRPWLDAASGRPAAQLLTATLTEGWSKKPGRAQFMPVRLMLGATGHEASRATAGGSLSHLVSRLVGVDGFAMVDAEASEVRAGDEIKVMMVP